MSGFESHIKEAIALNKERKTYYACQTNGESTSLSNVLILMERIVIPIAYIFDWKARKFNNKGISIVQNDFVPMKVKPKESKPKYTSTFSDELLDLEQHKVNSYLGELGTSIDLKFILDITLGFHQTVEQSEIRNNIHFAMLLHMLESVMLISKNGIGYSKQSNGKTKSLTLQLINIHKIAIKNALKMDRKANRFHLKNVGIIINDLPKISIP